MSARATLPPVPRAEIDDPGLRALIARSEETGIADSRFVRLMAHVPGYAEALHDALDRSADGGHGRSRTERDHPYPARQARGRSLFRVFPVEARAREDGLTEERIEAGCGDFETDDRFTPGREMGAPLRLADVPRSPKKVDKAFYDEGKSHYSEAQIVELGAFIAFHYGMQIFLGTLDPPSGRRCLTRGSRIRRCCAGGGGSWTTSICREPCTPRS